MKYCICKIKCNGHYGTGFEVIIHFTSPIRRLADDTNSRIIDDCYLFLFNLFQDALGCIHGLAVEVITDESANSRTKEDGQGQPKWVHP